MPAEASDIDIQAFGGCLSAGRAAATLCLEMFNEAWAVTDCRDRLRAFETLTAETSAETVYVDCSWGGGFALLKQSLDQVAGKPPNLQTAFKDDP